MKKIAINTALLLLSAAVALAASELILRFFQPQNLGHWYRTRDGLTTLRLNHRGVARGIETVQQYQTNSLGMRDLERRFEKAPGTYRILVLGDSYMEAFAMKFEDSFVRLLEAELSQAGKSPVEVINAGVSGWGTDDQLAYLRRYGVRFRPDLVLVAMTLNNDVLDNLDGRFHMLVDGKLAEKPVEQTSLLSYRVRQLKSFLGAHSHFYQLVRKQWYARDMTTDATVLDGFVAELLRKTPTDRVAKGWALTYQLVGKVRDTARDVGARTAVFLIPLHIQNNEQKLASFMSMHALVNDATDVEAPQKHMTVFGQRENIEVIDLLPCFKRWRGRHRQELYLTRDGHWSKNGHRLAARIVSVELRHRGLMEPERAGAEKRSARAPLETCPQSEL